MKLTRTQAIQKLTHARDQIAGLGESSASSPRFGYWFDQTLRLIVTLFPADSTYEKSFRELPFGLLFDPHFRPGTPEHEDTFRQSLEKAGEILTTLLVAMGAPGALPPGANLEAEAELGGPSADVLVVHGPDEALVHRITPVITSSERTRRMVTGWPEDPDVLTRNLAAFEKPFATLVVVTEGDLTPAKEGSNDPPSVPKDVIVAIAAAVKAFGEETVTVVVQTKVPMKPDQVPVKLLRIDSRGYWRKALGRDLGSLVS